LNLTEQGKSKKLKGKRKKKKNGLMPLNLFMERNKKICFETHSGGSAVLGVSPISDCRQETMRPY
jgi:hypothetical protein